MNETINVLIVDNDMLLIEGLVKVLEDFEAINCVGFACSGKECFNLIDEIKIDVILMDIRMETPTAGIDTATKILLQKGIKAPKIIFLTAHPQEEKAAEKAINGAMCLDKNIGIQKLNYIIISSYKEHLQIQQLSVSSKLDKEISRRFLKKRMSRPQFHVYCYLAKGYTIPFIARHIGLREATIRTYRRNIFARLSDFGVTDQESLERLEQQFDLCEEIF